MAVVRITYRACTLGSECDARCIACWTLTPASASAVLNARRNECQSTGSVVASRSRAGRAGSARASSPCACFPRSVRVPRSSRALRSAACGTHQRGAGHGGAARASLRSRGGTSRALPARTKGTRAPLSGFPARSHHARRNGASASGMPSRCGVRVFARGMKHSANCARSIIVQSHRFRSPAAHPPSHRATRASMRSSRSIFAHATKRAISSSVRIHRCFRTSRDLGVRTGATGLCSTARLPARRGRASGGSRAVS